MQSGRSSSPTQEAIGLMLRFADRTGLSSEQSPQRYLWTDAFALCNFTGLARATGEDRYLELAKRLAWQVHHTLGRHRADDPRTGWISGAGEDEGEAHPTRGGLRIGKALPERGPGDRFDERLEWDRDGQYFHYLTKWMLALDQLTRATGEPVYNLWARELAARASLAFVYEPRGGDRARMYWKMSIDLSRPLVASMGQHDPLDGYVACAQLQATASRTAGATSGPDLESAARRLASMIDRTSLATADPLGLGGLLADAARVEQLLREGALAESDLLDDLLEATLVGLEAYARQPDLQEPATRRLAFRELGLSIGLHAVTLLQEVAGSDEKRFPVGSKGLACLEALSRHVPMATEIEAFWRNPESQRTQLWSEHRDIDEVMLATSLAPEGFLVLHSPC